MNKKRGLSLIMLIVLAGVLGACQETLFSHSDNSTRSRIDRYWSGDSAVETRAARSRTAESGFGFPVGMANQ